MGGMEGVGGYVWVCRKGIREGKSEVWFLFLKCSGSRREFG